MQVTRTDISPCDIHLDVICTPEQVSDAYRKATKHFSKRVRVPGFRPGAAPAAMVEKMVTEDELNEQAAEELVRGTFKSVLAEHQLEPYGRPSVEVKKLVREPAEAEFLLKVPLAPVVELAEYRGIEVKRPNVEVTDAAVDEQIEGLRRRKSKREAVTDRGIEAGDIAVVNIKVDGETTDGRTFMIIVGRTFEALDQLLAGMEVEEMKTAELTFPEGFQEADWAGKTLVSHITLRSVSTVILPEVDDEFAKSFDVADMAELRERVREQMVRANEETVADYVNEQLLDAVVEKSNVHVPDIMWENVAERRLRELVAEQKERGRTVEQYAKENGMTIDELVQAWKTEAKVQVLRAVVVREIFVNEKMQMEESDLMEELGTMSREYRMAPDELMERLRQTDNVDELHFRVIFRKVTRFLTENAVVTPV